MVFTIQIKLMIQTQIIFNDKKYFKMMKSSKLFKFDVRKQFQGNYK